MPELELNGAKPVLADVVLPLALPRILTYQISSPQPLLPGMRVVVPLKGKRLYTGVLWKIRDEKPGDFEVRKAIEILDSEPFLNPFQLQFLSWLAEYYACTAGEALIAGLPAPYRLSSESYVQLHPDFDWRSADLESEALWLFSTLQNKGRMALADVAKAFGAGSAWIKKIRLWQQEGKLIVFDDLPDRYKPRMDTYVAISEEYRSDEAIENAFEKLKTRPGDEAFLLRFLSRTRFADHENPSWSIRKDLLDLTDDEKKILARLVGRKILVQWKEKADPYKGLNVNTLTIPSLSPRQQEAVGEIEQGWSQNKPALLHGVTGSGKTEIYIHLISNILANGKQCLLLLPEIAITIQIVARLRKVFGEEMGVYHSKAYITDRLEVWEGVASGKLRLVVGVRSSIFLPFNNLGLVVVDEEHDGSYKQADPAPRYQGRDSAMYLAHLHRAHVLLGSATPSVESYEKARSGRWKYVPLTERFGGVQLPEIQYIDMKAEARLLRVKLDFSATLTEELERTQAAGKQSVLFQNRRGYAPYLQCYDCDWIPYCLNCDVSLTYHHARAVLNCHYCGFKTDVLKHCQSCGSVNLQAQGYGTEKLEESLNILLPEARTGRMDQDNIQSRRSFERLLFAMQMRQIDVLVGTQMVTKGLDFEDVTTVGVFDMDRMLHYPEFRSNERTFQLLSQIAGRAGRRQERGKVLVQTFQPHHPVYKLAAVQDYDTFYQAETEHRKTFGYPPFGRLIRITARHREKEIVREATDRFAGILRKKVNPGFVLGPEPGGIPRLRNLFIFNMLIKIPLSVSPSKVKILLLAELHLFKTEKTWKSVEWEVDVDPN